MYLYDSLQVCESFVDGGVSIKALPFKLVMQDGFKALGEAVGLLLQPQLIL